MLGIKSLEDRTSVAPVDCFETLDQDLVLKLAQDYRLSYAVKPSSANGDLFEMQLDAEGKLEIVNRVLELKYGLILDSVKEVDNQESDIGTERQVRGFRLELMPPGY